MTLSARLLRLAQQLEDQHAPMHMTIMLREASAELLIRTPLPPTPVPSWSEVIAQKDAEIARLRDALRWYAEEHGYTEQARTALGEKA